MAKRNVKLQVQDLVRVVSIVAPWPHGVSVSGENSFYRAIGGKWAQESCAGWPHQWYATGELGKVQGRGRVGIVEGSCGYRSRGVSISGRIRFIKKPGVQDSGDRYVTKRSSEPRVAYTEVKVQVRDLVRGVGIVALLSHGGSVPGENSFYRAPGG